MEMNSQAHSAGVHTAMNIRALGLPSGTRGSTRREGRVRQEVSITVNALPEVADNIKFTQSLLLSSLVL